MILPKENQYFLSLAKTWILPIVETAVLILIVYKIRVATKRYKETRIRTPDFFTALKDACYQTLPKIAVMPFATEIAVFYYGFIHWKKLIPGKNEFTYHKNSGTTTLLIAIIFIIGIETSIIHLLLLKWSSTAAWIMTTLSFYTVIQLFGFLKSIIKRPMSIAEKELCLRYGILSEVNVAIEDIDSIELTTKSIDFNKETRRLSPFGDLESHNVIIRLKREYMLNGLYGIKRKFKALAFFIDNKNEFRDQVLKRQLD